MTVEESKQRILSVYPSAKIQMVMAMYLVCDSKLSFLGGYSATEDDAWILAAIHLDKALMDKLEL